MRKFLVAGVVGVLLALPACGGGGGTDKDAVVKAMLKDAEASGEKLTEEQANCMYDVMADVVGEDALAAIAEAEEDSGEDVSGEDISGEDPFGAAMEEKFGDDEEAMGEAAMEMMGGFEDCGYDMMGGFEETPTT